MTTPDRSIQGRLPRRALLGAAGLTGLQLGVAAALGACTQATTGRRVEYETWVEGDVGAGEIFVNAHGWSIAVSRAELCVGRLWYLEGASLVREASLWRRLLVPEAHAHPGHYSEGRVLGESTASMVVELLAAPTLLGAAEGVTGTLRSAHLSFHEPEGAGAGSSAPVATLEGVAERDGVRVPFVAEVHAAEVLSTVTEQAEVLGCPFEPAAVEESGVVTLVVGVQHWLDQVDFEATVSEEVAVLEPGSPPHNALARSMRRASAYQFTFEPAT